MTFQLQTLLDESAAREPDRVAIAEKDGGRTTYAELAQRSASVARVLRELGVRRGDRVGIHAKKTARSLAALFGILRAGAAYVPLDPSAPAARIATTIDAAGARVVVTSRALLASLRDAGGGAAIEGALLVDDAEPGARTDGHAERAASWDDVMRAPHDVDVAPARGGGIDTDLAYILYTSGSTGVPKGVAIDHRASLTFVSWAARRFELRPEDRVTSHAPLHFDLSTFDVLASVAAASTIVIVPEGTTTFPSRLADLLERERITVTYLVPSALSMMVEHGELARRDLTALRAVLFAGEVFPPKYLRAWLGHAPRARFYNLYGPTETNVCTYHEVDRDDAARRDEPVSIGAPIDNVDAFVIDADGRLVSEPGAVGELWVRGACLARGYFGDPERTARGFVPSPLHPGVVEPAYRTGDRVEIEADSRSYRYLGRLDHMVKTRGYRVELGEIEVALAAHPAIASAAALPIPDELVGNRIVAFVSLREGASVEEGELAAFCAQRLPRYMIPESIEPVASMPLTSSGKVDRSALSARSSGGREVVGR